jgi:hypothetical protein
LSEGEIEMRDETKFCIISESVLRQEGEAVNANEATAWSKRTRPSRVCLSRTSESLSTRRTSASSLVRLSVKVKELGR